MTEIRVATRRSPLALAQARWVGERLLAAHPGVAITFREVSTTGDLDRRSSVSSLTEVGAFVRAVQFAVIDGDADVAVHSCKDLPVDGPPELVAVYPEREAPWDVLCGSTLDRIPPGGRVGTGSPRRAAQLKWMRPDLEVVDIRGNVETRLGMVAAGDYAAVVLAEAGLRRIGEERAVAQRFTLREMVPAPGQAALAVEARADTAAASLIAAIEHRPTSITVAAEREVLAVTGAGCRAALGAFAQVVESGVTIIGFVEDDRGPRRAEATAQDGAAAAARLQEALAL